MNHQYMISIAFILYLCSIICYLPEVGIRKINPLYKDILAHKQETKNGTKRKHRYPDWLFKTYFSGLFPLSSANSAAVFLAKQEHNNAPVVKILSPENNTSVEPNALVRYAISVSDEEDGNSQYQEIASNEVFLEVIYLADASKAADYLSGNDQHHVDHPGLAVMKTSDCFNCHAIKSKLQGPPFSEIARRYTSKAMAVETLSMRVIKGNAGIWGSAAMPPHPDITQEQARQIIHWILENADDPNRDFYAGLEGAFRTKAKAERETGGVYILTASYTDHALKDMPQLKRRGQDMILLKSK